MPVTDDRLERGKALFDALLEDLARGDAAVHRGTMMGFPCLRVDDAFAASFDHRSGDLVVKLPRERVTALIEVGVGEPFAPAGRVFSEWVAIPTRDLDDWRALVEEAIAFVR